MTWQFVQSTGELLHNDQHVATGYSGDDAGLNAPAMESVVRIGPIPRGRWKIGAPYTHPHLGPVTMNLDPEPGTNTFGRSAFRIHGDNQAMDHTASEGCIVLLKIARLAIAASGDHELQVVADRTELFATSGTVVS